MSNATEYFLDAKVLKDIADNIVEQLRPEVDALKARAEKAEAENVALRARVKELTEQANAAYGPYQQKVNYLQNLVSMKDDALSSYAEFYGRAASLCGLPEDALPGSATDAIILQRLAEHDGIVALRAELDAANALVHEQDVIYMGHYQTVQEIRKAIEELFTFIEAHADKTFLAHATTLIDFRARIMPKNFPNTAAIASHEARKGSQP